MDVLHKLKVNGNLRLEEDSIDDFLDDLEETFREHSVDDDNGNPHYYFEWE